MTDRSQDSSVDPFAILRTHVRALALLERPAEPADELVAGITGSIDRADRSHGAQVVPLHFGAARSPRGRRWFVSLAAASAVVVGGAGVAAYVATRPTDPVAGIVCRESAEFGSLSIVLPLDGDPIAACANLWRTGDLPATNPDGVGGDVPELIACAGGQGAVEVLPAVVGSCADVGLFESAFTSNIDPVAELGNRLTAQMSEGCRPAGDWRRFAQEQLTALGLADWTVKVEDESATCAIVAADSSRRQVVVITDPRSTSTP